LGRGCCDIIKGEKKRAQQAETKKDNQLSIFGTPNIEKLHFD
jgi:hypothetical protein